MNSGKRVCLAFLAVFVSLTAMAQEPKAVRYPEELGFAPDRLERITKAFQSWVDDDLIPGAVVLIARDNRIAYYRAFGYRDRERKLAMTTDAIFRVGAMTKPIVSVAAMTLVEEARLDLTSPVDMYLPEWKDLQVGVEQKNPATEKIGMTTEPPKRRMTVHDLLRHTSGLVYDTPVGVGLVNTLYHDSGVSSRDETLDQMVTKLSMLPLAHQPGEVWDYSMATDALGRVIEIVSGMELDRFVQERVTKPLGMISTGFYVQDTDRDRIAQPRVDPATGQRQPIFDPVVRPKRFSGAGGAVSTAADYLRFCEMLLDHGKLGPTRILAPSTVNLMTANALPPEIGFGSSVVSLGDQAPTPAMGQGYGLGFGVRIEAGRNPLPGSVGSYYWNGAHGTSFYVDPDLKLIFIMMMQVSPDTAPRYWNAIRNLTYQSLVSSE